MFDVSKIIDLLSSLMTHEELVHEKTILPTLRDTSH